MTPKKIEISEENVKKLTDLEASIQHWSQQHTQLSLDAQNALEQVRTLTEARQQIVRGLISSADVDLSSIAQVSLSPEQKTLDVLIRE